MNQQATWTSLLPPRWKDMTGADYPLRMPLERTEKAQERRYVKPATLLASLRLRAV
jgi:hypothetical protein